MLHKKHDVARLDVYAHELINRPDLKPRKRVKIAGTSATIEDRRLAAHTPIFNVWRTDSRFYVALICHLIPLCVNLGLCGEVIHLPQIMVQWVLLGNVPLKAGCLHGQVYLPMQP